MKLFIVLAAFVAAASASSSSCTVTEPVSISSVNGLPPSIETELAQAYSYAADITTIGSIISTIALSSPSISYAEYVIASYEESYSTIISYIESIYSSPSLLPPSSEASFSYLTSIHSTLASAIGTIVAIESSHYSLASVQSTLESIELTQPSILTYLSEFTEVASPSVYYATEVIEYATISSPSIVPTFIEVYTAVSSYPAVSSALVSLSYQLYTLPSTVVCEVVSYINSPSVVAPSVIASLSSCYGSVYTEVTSVVEFTYSHSSVVTAITNLIYAESSVSSLTAAIDTVIEYQFPTLTYQTYVLSAVTYTLPSVYTDVEYLSYFEATSPALSVALSTIEQSFYESPSIASYIYSVVVSPSVITSPTHVEYLDFSHQSLVSALTEVLSFESANPSVASTISTIISSLTTAFETERTLLTAIYYLSALTSPSTFTASAQVSTLLSVVTDINTVLSYIDYVVYNSPSLSCPEEVIEAAAYYYPYYVTKLWTVYESPSLIVSDFSVYSYIEDVYSTVAEAISLIVSAEVSFPGLSTIESSFIAAATQDSSLVTIAYYLLSNFESLTCELSSLLS